jgi:predicted DNA-binding antitoxin AbrB/MazE fold protein
MTITIDATYEDGVLKPAQPLPLAEHAQVRVTVEPGAAEVQHSTPAAERAGPSLAERIIARGKALPQDVLEKLPCDGASQHDHYVYGTTNRTDLRS